MRIRDYMTTDVVTANLRDGAHQTFFRMRERDIRHMPVLDDAQHLAGIVSDRDLRRPGNLGDDPNHTEYYALDNDTLLEEVMSRDPFVVRPDDDLIEAVDWLAEKRLGALPVVDDQRRVVGIISAVDLLRAFRETLERD